MRFMAPSARGAVALATLILAACSTDRVTAVTETALPVDDPSAALEIVSVRIGQSSDSVAVGDSLRLTALVMDATGKLVSGVPAKWSSSRTDRATISSSGVVHGREPGGVTIKLETPYKSTYTRVYVVAGTGSAPAPAPSAPDTSGEEPASDPIVVPGPTPPPNPGDVAVRLQRFDGGSGTVLVSSGVPLVPGTLYPGQERQVRLFVGGTELPVAVWSLPSTNRDGSLRTVMIQASYSVPSSGVAARLSIGSARPTAKDRSRLAVASVPKAAVLPSDPAYLVATELVGPTITAAQTSAMGGDFSRFESDFVRFADHHWSASGDAYGENYYDRALIYYAFWVRTGNPTYWYRGSRMAYRYRRDYLESNNYGASPHWSQLEGLEKHYLLTGDEQSRKAVAATADMLYRGFQSSRDLADRSKSESRIRARVLQGNLLAWRLNAPAGRDGRPWATRLDEAVTKILSTQSSDGGFRFASTCWQTLNYMDGLLADALIEVHRTYRADSRIVSSVKRLADYQWSKQWVSSSNAFKYVSATCDGVGGTKASPDLNGLMVNTFSWVHAQTGDATYRQRADAVFFGTVGSAWLSGTKQFNQQYSTSYRHLAYRR